MTAESAAVASATALWCPAIVLPSQLAYPNLRQRSPEMRLVAAILEDALVLITRQPETCRGRRRREFLEAWNWLWSERRDWPFAFKNVCDLLALDASAVRRRVRHQLAARDAKRRRATHSERVTSPQMKAAG